MSAGRGYRAVVRALRTGQRLSPDQVVTGKIATIDTLAELQGYRDGAAWQGRALTPFERRALTRREAEIVKGAR